MDSNLGIRTVVPSGCNGAGGCQSLCDFAKLAENLLHDAIYLAMVGAAIAFVWAGIRLVASGGNPAESQKAKASLKYNLTGLAIILGAFLVVDVLMRTLIGSSALPWNQLC